MASSETAQSGERHADRSLPGGIPTRYYMIGIAAYSTVLALVMWRRGGFIEPDFFLIWLLLAAVLLGRPLAFLRDWVPFAFVLFGWQILRGYADNAADGRGFPLHNEDLIRWERALFGGELPTLWLQERLYTPGEVHWWDIGATAFWSFHFVLPLAFAFLLWLRSRALYWRFVYALLLLSFAGFATYVVFPAVPPWLASLHYGTISERVWMVRDEVFRTWDMTANFSEVAQRANPNLVAAMPSLHAAYPTLVFLFCLRHWRLAAPFACLYCCCLWFSIVYVGDHYAIDAIVGALYAGAAFAAVELAYRAWERRRPERRAPDAPAGEAAG